MSRLWVTPEISSTISSSGSRSSRKPLLFPLMKSNDMEKPVENLCIGFLGADWRGSDALAMANEFRRRENLLIERCYEDFLPTRWSHPLLRIARRLLSPLLALDYNRSVLELLKVSGLDFLLVFKGRLLSPRTLRQFTEAGIPCYCFYPDVSFYDHGRNIPACLPLYDAVFTSKSYHLEDPSVSRMIRRLEYAPHGFDPDVHRPTAIQTDKFASYTSDVSFVGMWSKKKEATLALLISEFPDLNIKIWGPNWYLAEKTVQEAWQGRGAYGDELRAIYALSRINLGLLSEAGSKSTQGDQTTARTWQIPGSGGVILHEDTPEFRQAFEIGKEAYSFDSPQSLISQVKVILQDEEKRKKVAESAFHRSISTPYTYARAVQIIVNTHREVCKAPPSDKS